MKTLHLLVHLEVHLSVQLRLQLMVHLKSHLDGELKGALEVALEMYFKFHIPVLLLVHKSTQNDSIKDENKGSFYVAPEGAHNVFF